MRIQLRYDVAKVRIAKFLAYAFLGFYAITCLGPFVWSIMSAFKTNDEILVYPFRLPRVPQFSAFPTAWTVGNFAMYFRNTVFYVAAATAVLLVVAPMAAYVIARVMSGGAVYTYFTLGIMIPLHTILLPSLILTKVLGLINTRLSLVLVYVAFHISISIFILVGFMKTIPKEFEESAYMDGGGRATAFFKIVFPLTRPAIATVGLLTVIENWNSYLLPLIIITAKPLKVITQGLQELKSLYWTDYGLLSAGLVISFVPMVLIYILFQEQVIAGLTAGGLKG